MTIVRSAIEKYVYDTDLDRRPDGMLWASDLGYHPARAMHRLLHGITPTFDADVRVKMDGGVAMEQATLAALRYTYSGVLANFPLWNDAWSGYADFILDHGTSMPVIIEHKAQGDNYWNYRDSLPRSTHVCQLWLYGQLYREMYSIVPKLVLFYRAWGKWAEYEVIGPGDDIHIRGWLDGHRVETRQLPYAPSRLRQELETFYKAGNMPRLPEQEDTWTYAEESYDRLRG